MKTICFSAIKGGVGKSSLSILTANALSAAGKKVLVIDLDIQNSTTFYYLQDPGEAEEHNAAKALQENRLEANLVRGLFLDLLPSSFNLIKLRSLPEKTLSRILKKEGQGYDYIVIDSAPTFDNMVLNAVHASDMIVTPAYLSQFDWKSALFLRDQIDLEAEKLSSWRLLLNRYKAPRTDNPDAETNQYLDLFEEDFSGNLLDTRIPETRQVQKTIDTGGSLTAAKNKRPLRDAVLSLAEELTGENIKAEKI